MQWEKPGGSRTGQGEGDLCSRVRKMMGSGPLPGWVPQWGLGTHHWLVVLHEMFLCAAEQGQREAECMFCWGCWGSIFEPDPGVDQSAMELVGYWTSLKEMRDLYHSVYLLKRSPGPPPVENDKGEGPFRIYSPPWWSNCKGGHILPHLEIRTIREGSGLDWTNGDLMKQLFGQPARGHWRLPKPSRVTSRGLKRNEGKDHRLVLTTEVEVGPDLALEVGPETRSRGWSRNRARANSQSHSHGDLQGMHPCSPNKPPPRKRVTVNDPKDEKDPAREEEGCSMEPSIGDLEMWLEFQAGQLGTPTWWEELGAMPGIKDWCKFTWKIRASFYILEVWMRAYPEQGYTAPPAPQSLNRSAFLPERLTYQDVWQQPALLTLAYAQSLQYWAEKHNLLRNPNFRTLVGKHEGVVTDSVRICDYQLPGCYARSGGGESWD